MDYIYPAARADEDEVDASSGASSRAPSTSNNPDKVCHPHNVALPHKQLHGGFSRTEQGRVPIPHTLHGRALKHTVSLIMKSMQIAPLAQALGPGNPCAPAQHNRQ